MVQKFNRYTLQQRKNKKYYENSNEYQRRNVLLLKILRIVDNTTPNVGFFFFNSR